MAARPRQRSRTSQTGRKPLRAVVLALAAALPLAIAPAARADLSPDLAARLVQTPADQRLSVIVTLTQQVDPGAYQGRPRELLRELRSTAGEAQSPLQAR